jgi:predicted phosphodiesterase
MSTRFVVLADTHYHPSAPKDFAPPKLLTRGPEIQAATIPAVNAVQPEFIVHAGDLLCGGGSFELSRADYDRSLRDVKAAYDGFDAPFYCVAGNHDCDAQDYRYGDFLESFGAPSLLAVDDVSERLSLARAHIFPDGSADTGTWSDDLDEALRRADAQARQQHRLLLLVTHTWFHPGPGDDPQRAVIGGAARLQQTVAESPSVAACFAGHRHANRVRLFRDYLCVDTACLIGYPLGFREIEIDDDGWMTCRWHRLDLPEVFQSSAELGTAQDRERWAGEFGDRDTTVLLPRARGIQRR